MKNEMEKARCLLEGRLEAIETIENKIESLEKDKYEAEEGETLSEWQKDANERNQRRIEGLKLIIELLLK